MNPSDSSANPGPDQPLAYAPAGAARWDAIRARMEAVRLRAERGWDPSSSEAKEMLRTRARRLATPPKPDEDQARIGVVLFHLAGETYAVESLYVRGVHPLKTLTPLPGAPAFVLGITNLRGEILSVIDLKKFFGLPEKGLTDLSTVIVLQSDVMQFGILADEVVAAQVIPVSRIQPALPTLTGVREKYLRGVTEERVVILDASALLADDTLIVCDEVEGRPGSGVAQASSPGQD